VPNVHGPNERAPPGMCTRLVGEVGLGRSVRSTAVSTSQGYQDEPSSAVVRRGPPTTGLNDHDWQQNDDDRGQPQRPRPMRCGDLHQQAERYAGDQEEDPLATAESPTSRHEWFQSRLSAAEYRRLDSTF
jgi:hypothetical protein